MWQCNVQMLYVSTSLGMYVHTMYVCMCTVHITNGNKLITYVHVHIHSTYIPSRTVTTCISICSPIFLVMLGSNIMKNFSSVFWKVYLRTSAALSPFSPMSVCSRILGIRFLAKSHALLPLCPSSTMYSWTPSNLHV